MRKIFEITPNPATQIQMEAAMKDITVLFVDDEKSVLTSLERYLITESYQKVFAQSANEALDILAVQPVHVVVSDMKMPGTDGLTLLRKIKKTYPETIRMVLSGFSEIAQIVPCINTGEIFRYLTKPIDPEEFKAVLYDAIEQYLMKRDKQELVQRLAKSYLKVKKRKETYQDLSLKDDLTGLFNTRYLYSDLEDRFVSHPDYLSLAFMDVDHFKQVVDENGHMMASMVLKELGQKITGYLKPPCYGVAFGGDLFVVVMPGCDRDKALDTVQSLSSAIQADTYFSKKGRDIKLTLSFGLATCPVEANRISTLLSRADRNLSEAKKARR